MSDDKTLKIYGIRHHGPGSAKNLLNAIEKQAPDAVLIEAPEDALSAFKISSIHRYNPPIAVVQYINNSPDNRLYLPFAEFSPEWNAMQYAIQYNASIQFIDLPASKFLNISDEKENNTARRIDPIKTMAKIAGHDDPEIWWEETFEIYDQAEQIFEILGNLIREIRSENREEKKLTLLREAYMREKLRDALSNYSNIAIVCGAYHVSALQDHSNITATEDRELLKELPRKVSVETEVIPWSYPRLSTSRMYQSGVKSPAWYASIFKGSESVFIDWFSRAAEVLRSHDYHVSPAHVISANNLLQQILDLRNRQFPGLIDMKDVCITSLCNGHEERWKIVKDEIVVGRKIGSVPEDLHTHPIVEDFYQKIKSARLSSYIKSTVEKEKELDLRKVTHRKASRLFHTMTILEIPWAIELEDRARALGSFHEDWVLQWKEDYLINITIAGLKGSTLKQAAENTIREKIKRDKSIIQLIQAFMSSLKADLSINSFLLEKLHNRAIESSDISELMEVTIKLHSILQVGSVYEFDHDAINNLVNSIVNRVIAKIHTAYHNIADDEAVKELKRLFNFHEVVLSSIDSSLRKRWLKAINKLISNDNIHPEIHGQIVRLNHQNSLIDSGELTDQISFHLSYNQEILKSAYWIEGLLYGSELRLLHESNIISTLDHWLTDINNHSFKQILPVLRRTFSHFSSETKQGIYHILAEEFSIIEESTHNIESDSLKNFGKTYEFLEEE